MVFVILNGTVCYCYAAQHRGFTFKLDSFPILDTVKMQKEQSCLGKSSWLAIFPIFPIFGQWQSLTRRDNQGILKGQVSLYH